MLPPGVGSGAGAGAVPARGAGGLGRAWWRVPLGLVCFRACPPNEDLDALNESIMHGVNASGRALLSHTRLNDKLTLRLSIGNIRTTEKHVRNVWELLNEQLRLQP